MMYGAFNSLSIDDIVGYRYQRRIWSCLSLKDGRLVARCPAKRYGL